MSDIRERNKNKHNDASVSKNLQEVKGVKTTTPASMPSRTTSLRILSRVVVIFSLLIVVYFSSKDEKLRPFARQTDLLVGKGEVVQCSPDYLREVDQYEGCFPRECKRFVTDKVITVMEAEELMHIAKRGLSLGGSSGGASILDLHSGALSLGESFINIYKIKKAENLFTEHDFTVYRVVKEKIKYAIAHHFKVHPNKIYLTHPTFFSEITSRNAKTIHDEYWHPHVDKETYKSFHYTTLLYLNDYNKDFNGGRFVFIEEQFNKTVEPRKARLSMFTSGRENLHYVEKVTSGVRYAMTISFTCNKQFAIDDPSLKKYEN